MPRSDRIVIIVSLVVLGLTLSLLVPLPVLEIKLPLGPELVLRVSGPVQLAIILFALICADAQSGVRAHHWLDDPPLAYTITFGPLPGLLVIMSLVLVPCTHGLVHGLAWWGYRIAFIGLSGATLAAVITLQYHSLDATGGRRARARVWLSIASYTIALILYIALYGLRWRSLFSATGVLAVSGLLSLELLREESQHIGRTWLYAGIIALAMGELTWALNYCSLDAKVGGYLLLLVFYLLTGLSQQYLWGRLKRRVAIEYSLVGAAGLAALLALAQYAGV